MCKSHHTTLATATARKQRTKCLSLSFNPLLAWLWLLTRIFANTFHVLLPKVLCSAGSDLTVYFSVYACMNPDFDHFCC